MTEAGWTRNADVKEAGFYWLVWAERLPQVVQVREASVHFTSGLTISLEEVNGQFLGPITPDSYQQGRGAGLREAIQRADEMGYQSSSSHVRSVVGLIVMDLREKLAQQAQEGGVGDGN